MTNSRLQTSGLIFLLSISLLLTFLLFGLRNSDLFTTECSETGDFAAHGLSVERAKSLDELRGPYSRLRVNHPGPALAYSHALAESVLPYCSAPYGCHVLFQFLLNGLFLGAAILVAAKLGASLFAALTLPSSIFLVSFLFPALPFSTWGPDAIVFPFLCCLVSIAAVSAGKSTVLPIALLSGLFAVHSHLALIPPVAAAAIPALVSLIRHRKAQPLSRTSVFLSLAILFLFLLPPLLDLIFHGDKSNPVKIWERIIREDGSHALFPTLRFVSAALLPGVFESGEGVLSVLTLVIAAGGTLFCTLFAPTPFFRSLGAVLFFVLTVSTLSFLSTPGKLFPYLATYLIGVSVLLCSLGLALLFRTLTRSSAVRTGCVVLFSLSALLVPFIAPEPPANPLCNSGPKLFVEKLRPSTTKLYAITIGGKEHQLAWGESVGAALELKRRGFHFCVPPRWQFLFGPESSCKEKLRGAFTREQLVFVTFYRSDRVHPKGTPLIRLAEVLVFVDTPQLREKWLPEWPVT